MDLVEAAAIVESPVDELQQALSLLHPQLDLANVRRLYTALTALKGTTNAGSLSSSSPLSLRELLEGRLHVGWHIWG